MPDYPTKISREELMALAREARGGRTQTEVASELEVSQPAVSQAERDPSPSNDALRIRIVEHYTGFRVEVQTWFILHKR